MKNILRLTAAVLLLLSFRPALAEGVQATPTATVHPVLVHLTVKADEKILKDLGYFLKGELELIEGVTVTEDASLPADYELNAIEVDEPLGRMALSVNILRPFNQKDNLAGYRKLLADHWKGGIKPEEWTAFEQYFKSYAVVVSHQILTGRKGKVRDLCTSVADAFSREVLKRPVRAEATPGETPAQQ